MSRSTRSRSLVLYPRDYHRIQMKVTLFGLTFFANVIEIPIRWDGGTWHTCFEGETIWLHHVTCMNRTRIDVGALTLPARLRAPLFLAAVMLITFSVDVPAEGFLVSVNIYPDKGNRWDHLIRFYKLLRRTTAFSIHLGWVAIIEKVETKHISLWLAPQGLHQIIAPI